MTTTTSLAVNSNNDIYLDENGNIAIVTDLLATLQACEQAVKTKLGELVLDTTRGVPYFETVFVGVPNLQIFNAGIKAAIIAEPGVVQIVALATKVNGGILSYTAEIQTVYGTGSILGEINNG